VLLSPIGSGTPACFSGVSGDPDEFTERLGEMQRLRGGIYLKDGAITEAELTADGRHHLPEDSSAWHLLLTEGNRVKGCMRYLLHRSAVPVARLGVSGSALAKSEQWGEYLTKALHAQLTEAQNERLGFAEIGGWALAEELRASTEGIRIVLATYALAQLLGNATGVSTATTRNGSARILRRLGGRSVICDDLELPPYFDPHYKCDMEILRFDSRLPNPRYAEWVDHLQSELHLSRVICATQRQAARKFFPLQFAADFQHTI